MKKGSWIKLLTQLTSTSKTVYYIRVSVLDYKGITGDYCYRNCDGRMSELMGSGMFSWENVISIHSLKKLPKEVRQMEKEAANANL